MRMSLGVCTEDLICFVCILSELEMRMGMSGIERSQVKRRPLGEGVCLNFQ